MNPIQKIIDFINKISNFVTGKMKFTVGDYLITTKQLEYSKSKVKIFRIHDAEGYELFSYDEHLFDTVSQFSLSDQNGHLLDWSLVEFNIEEESKKDDIELILTHGKVFDYNEDTIDAIQEISSILDALIPKIIKTL